MLRISLALLAVLIAAQATRAGIDGIAPDHGTLGTLITVQGDGFGSKKPRAWLSLPGAKKRYPLQVVAFDDAQITVRLRGGVAGPLELHVKPRDAAPVTAPTLFEIRAPEVQLVEQPVVTRGDTLDVHVEFAGDRRLRVFVGGRRARVLMRDDATGHLAVRVRTARGSHTVTVKNRIGEAAWASGVAVLDANGSLGPPAMRYRANDVVVSTPEVALMEPSASFPQPFVLRSADRIGYSCRDMFLGVPLDLELPLPQAWSDGETVVFEQWRRCCFPPKPKPGTGCNASVQVRRLDPGLPWRIEILATDGERIAGAFYGTLMAHPQPIQVSHGTFVVDLAP